MKNTALNRLSPFRLQWPSWLSSPMSIFKLLLGSQDVADPLLSRILPNVVAVQCWSGPLPKSTSPLETLQHGLPFKWRHQQGYGELNLSPGAVT